MPGDSLNSVDTLLSSFALWHHLLPVEKVHKHNVFDNSSCYLESLYRRLMRFNVIFIFFVIRLMATLSEDLRVDCCYFPGQLNGNLLRFRRQLVCN